MATKAGGQHAKNDARVFLSPPHVSNLERDLLLAAFDSNWIAPAGPDLALFEAELGQWTQRAYVVALSSGTSALHLALLMLGIGPGDEVIVPTLTFVATANAVAYTGASPVFIDSEPSTMNLDPELLGEELQRCAGAGHLPKAVISVDLYGQSARYEDIEAVCARYDVPLVEDAAEGLGGSRSGRACGSFGVMAALSFNGNKIVTTSGGGALVADDPSLIERARYLSTQARMPVAHYEHEDIGYNYRMSNLLAALGRGQLAWLDKRIDRRREIRERYKNALQHVAGVAPTPIDPANASNHWLTTITIDPLRTGLTPEQVRLHLEASNIETRPLWKPMHLQPVFKANRAVLNGVSDRLYETGLCLPSGSSLSSDQQDLVIAQLLDALR